MAQSPTHKFGQIIGDLLEEMIKSPLQDVANKHGLYLDYKHARPARNNRKLVKWIDHKGNSHDLDYVLEHGGSENTKGSPKAFIESAWRRYTKHSRNKAQEIQGAVTVLAETFSEYNPFLGAVLAGVYTDGSITQLKSHGFSVVYSSYQSIRDAFATVGIDAFFDEDTDDDVVQAKVDQFDALNSSQRSKLLTELQKGVQQDLDTFIVELEKSLTRKIDRIFVATLHGPMCELKTVEEAVNFITSYNETERVSGFVRYEVNVRYSNGDDIVGNFEDKTTAVKFLNGLV